MASTGSPSLAAMILLFCDTGIGLQKLLAQRLTLECHPTFQFQVKGTFYLVYHSCHIVEIEEGGGY